MIHLRIVAPSDRSERLLRTLEANAAVLNIITVLTLIVQRHVYHRRRAVHLRG